MTGGFSEYQSVPGHHVEIRYSGICGEIDVEDARASCSCGWATGWDCGWRIITRLRVWWHLRRDGAA